MGDPYQDNTFLQDSSYSTYEGGTQGGYEYQEDYPRQDEDAASDATEGRDDEDQMYEGEYQGIPHPDDAKVAQRVARAKGPSDEENTLPEEYESIIEDCSHGRFQWTLFVAAGLALMADGVECFVVGFVLPSAEKDMCLSNANKGMLGKWGGFPQPPDQKSFWDSHLKRGSADVPLYRVIHLWKCIKL